MLFNQEQLREIIEDIQKFKEEENLIGNPLEYAKLYAKKKFGCDKKAIEFDELFCRSYKAAVLAASTKCIKQTSTKPKINQDEDLKNVK